MAVETEFKISANSNLDYMIDPNSRSSVMGVVVYIEGASIVHRNTMQRAVALLLTEADSSAPVMAVKDTMFFYPVITFLGQKERLFMKQEPDSS